MEKIGWTDLVKKKMKKRYIQSRIQGIT